MYEVSYIVNPKSGKGVNMLMDYIDKNSFFCPQSELIGLHLTFRE